MKTKHPTRRQATYYPATKILALQWSQQVQTYDRVRYDIVDMRRDKLVKAAERQEDNLAFSREFFRSDTFLDAGENGMIRVHLKWTFRHVEPECLEVLRAQKFVVVVEDRAKPESEDSDGTSTTE